MPFSHQVLVTRQDSFLELLCGCLALSALACKVALDEIYSGGGYKGEEMIWGLLFILVFVSDMSHSPLTSLSVVFPLFPNRRREIIYSM